MFTDAQNKLPVIMACQKMPCTPVSMAAYMGRAHRCWQHITHVHGSCWQAIFTGARYTLPVIMAHQKIPCTPVYMGRAHRCSEHTTRIHGPCSWIVCTQPDTATHKKHFTHNRQKAIRSELASLAWKCLLTSASVVRHAQAMAGMYFSPKN